MTTFWRWIRERLARAQFLFDHEGTIKAIAQREFEQILPKAGWVEARSRRDLTSQIGVAIEALGRAQLKTP